MDNPVIIAVFLVAAAQALTILLTFRRERDIKELRELYDEQRLHIVELRAWLAGRNAARLERIKFEGDPISEPTVNNSKVLVPAIAPKGVPETTQLRITGDQAAPSGQGSSGSSSSGQEQWPIEDLQRFVARLKEGQPPEPTIPSAPEPAITPKSLPDSLRPGTSGDELERANKAINWLKEDADKAREMGPNLHGVPAEKKVG